MSAIETGNRVSSGVVRIGRAGVVTGCALAGQYAVAMCLKVFGDGWSPQESSRHYDISPSLIMASLLVWAVGILYLAAGVLLVILGSAGWNPGSRVALMSIGLVGIVANVIFQHLVSTIIPWENGASTAVPTLIVSLLAMLASAATAIAARRVIGRATRPRSQGLA